MAIPYLACMALVAQVYALPPRVLPSIQAVEGGAVGSVHLNRDGSEDYGVMQINSRWVHALGRVARMPDAAVQQRLVGDACFNIAAAGLIMRSYLNEAGGDLLRAVGYYHSHTQSLGEPYRLRVVNAAARLFAQANARAVPANARARMQPAGYRVTLPAGIAHRPGMVRSVSGLSRH
jgi:hypothetical protein